MSDHVKGMTSCRPPEDDCVSRQGAIDVVCNAGCGSGFCGVECDEVLALRNMPSAQPEKRTHERTETHACDLISRQAAIDAIGILLEQSEDDEHDKIWNNAIRGSINAVKHHLPSAQPDLSGYSSRLWKAAYERGKADAQPDIIHCGECKHRDPEDHKCDCGHDILWQLPRDDEWYCADAERKEGGGDADTEV